MKARTLSLMAGLGGSLLLGGAADAAFTGITVESKGDNLSDSAGTAVFVCNVYANFSDPNDQMIAVAGTPLSPMLVQVVGGTFYQAIGMGGSDNAPTTFAASLNTNLLLDSFVTIDAKLIGSAAYGGDFTADATQLTPGWPGFCASTLGPNDGVGGTNLGWFITAAAAPQGLADGGQVLLAQFSATGPDPLALGITGTFLIQWDDAAGNTTQETVAFAHFVPAPGALALLGMAGLIGKRRRRN